MALTRTQREALEALRTTPPSRQWPLGQGRLRGDGPSPVQRFSRRTLQALVDAGHARWVYLPGVMPHIIPTD